MILEVEEHNERICSHLGLQFEVIVTNVSTAASKRPPLLRQTGHSTQHASGIHNHCEARLQKFFSRMPYHLTTALILLILSSVPVITGQQEGCQCGFEALCSNGTCACPKELTLHANGRDCRNDTCADGDCLKCSEVNECIRCAKFILRGDRICVDKCSGEAEVHSSGPYQGNVCTLKKKDDGDSKLIIGVVAGVGAGLVLCLVAILVVCFYIRKTRKNVSLQSQQYKSANMETGHITQHPAYDNRGYVNDTSDIKTGVIDPEVYSHQLEQLRPHTETLMTLLAQIRPKLRAMEPGDARISTYKGVIHQLCRVLVLLHRKDTGSSIPSDALGLIEWAHQMLEDHNQQQELQDTSVGPDVLGDLGHNRISYIDVDMETERLQAPLPASPAVYAEPVGSANQSLRSESIVTPYSSVPVPLPAGNSTFPGTYATIRRTPSVPGAPNTSVKGGYVKPTLTHQISQSSQPKNKSIGYFANGRYYDPNPMPQPEVYAPASSYSDRSTAHMSTFVPDRPRSSSFSSTDASSEREGLNGDVSDGEGDLFPFDPKDATDPVEV